MSSNDYGKYNEKKLLFMTVGGGIVFLICWVACLGNGAPGLAAVLLLLGGVCLGAAAYLFKNRSEDKTEVQKENKAALSEKTATSEEPKAVAEEKESVAEDWKGKKTEKLGNPPEMKKIARVSLIHDFEYEDYESWRLAQTDAVLLKKAEQIKEAAWEEVCRLLPGDSAECQAEEEKAKLINGAACFCSEYVCDFNTNAACVFVSHAKSYYQITSTACLYCVLFVLLFQRYRETILVIPPHFLHALDWKEELQFIREGVFHLERIVVKLPCKRKWDLEKDKRTAAKMYDLLDEHIYRVEEIFVESQPDGGLDVGCDIYRSKIVKVSMNQKREKEIQKVFSEEPLSMEEDIRIFREKRGTLSEISGIPGMPEYLRTDRREWEHMMKKVMVIGCPGSGKSTFSRRLNQITGLPVLHLDMIFHKPDKTVYSNEEFDAQLRRFMEQDEWIIDGNYARTIPIRLEQCDTVFWLDYPLEVCLKGIEERIGKPRPDLPWSENELDEEFAEYVKNFERDKRPELVELLKLAQGKEVHIFTSREMADEYLQGQTKQQEMTGNDRK